MKRIKHPSVLEMSREEIIKFQLSFILRQFKFNDTQLLILAYLYLHQDDATDKLLDDGILGSYQTVKNYISRLRKTGLVHGNKLHPKIKVFEEDLEYTIKLKVNEVEQVV